MKNIDDFKLTRDTTVGELRHWIASKDTDSKKKIIDLIHYRFEKRYTKHLHVIDSGFLRMAVACLTIETLESFKQGLTDTKRASRQMFRDFFKNETSNFPDFSDIADDFYENVRCGILHQAETTNAWRILPYGSLLDRTEKVINSKLFVDALDASINNYIQSLETQDWEDSLWKSAIVKLEDICNNCSVTKTYA